MPESESKKKKSPVKSGAYIVALGIFLSRIAGLVRERAFAHYFGNSDAGDAFKAALKIPNFLQNLFGEGVLSASLIPVYAKLNSEGKKEEASQLASTVATLLCLCTSLLVLAGVMATPVLIDLIAPGFTGEKRTLTIKLVQIFFPGTGILVMSAWCLGILNSHRKFFLSYTAPVIWNLAIIATLLFFGRHNDQYSLAEITAWGLVAGSFLQFFVQLPSALRLIHNFKPAIMKFDNNVRTVVRNFFPVVISRGVVQVSAYIDNLLASLLPAGAVSSLAYAQTLYLLPVSLFGMSVSVSELPAMSEARGSDAEISDYLKTRLNRGLKQIAFFIIPSVAGFLILGDVIVSAIFQTGQFDHNTTIYVWGILAGSTAGLLATTLGRLYSSAFYSIKDTRTPLKFALVRVFLTTLLGCFCAFIVPGLLGIDSKWGTAGLTVSAGIAGWAEFYLLRRGLNRIIGETGLTFIYQMKLWPCALIAAFSGFAIKYAFFPESGHTIIRAAIILSVYGIIYFSLTYIFEIEESRIIIGKILKKISR